VTVTSASAGGALGRMHSTRNDNLQVVRDTPGFAGKPLPLGHAFRWAGPTDANRSGISSYNARRTALSVPKCAKNIPPLAVTNGGRFRPITSAKLQSRWLHRVVETAGPTTVFTTVSV
jgi:hypothetical protein